MALREQARKQYGPLMTFEFFTTRWVSRYNSFMKHYKSLMYPEKENDGFWTLDFCTEGLELNKHFMKQKIQHKPMRFGVFPNEPPENPEERQWRTDYVNPYAASIWVIFQANAFVKALMDMKYGYAMDGPKWQELPMWVRKSANDLIVDVREASEDGWWVDPYIKKEQLSEEIRKFAMYEVQSREQQEAGDGR